MTFLNARTKNTGNNQGDIYDYFKDEISNLIQHNGGNHYFNWKSFDCFESTAPHPVNTKSYLRLTTDNFDMTHFDKSFIHVVLDITLALTGSYIVDGTYSDEIAKACKIFVGLKNSAEFFHKLDTLCKNIMLKNTQDNAIREQFAYNTIKGKAQKTTAKFSHSTWANVSKMDPSVCGLYLSPVELASGAKTYQMELIIPYTDFLKYQAFTLYPNKICGELTELVQTSTEAFVWAPINPLVAIETEEFLSGTEFTYKDVSNALPITRKFTQIGNNATIPLLSFVSDSPSWGVADVSLSIQSATVQSMKTFIAGLDAKSDVNQGVYNLLEDGVYIPSQTMERRSFPKSPGTNGIETNTDIALSNTTNITVMCPKRVNDCTVFENIMYQNVSLSVNKHQYPDSEVSTIGPRFYQMQLVANELDGTLEATAEFEESYTQPLNNPSTGERYPLCRSDGTSFGINFQLERSNGGYVFDGIDTGSKTVPITFKGQPIWPGTNDTYYNYDATNTSVHPQPPELWICQDTYFKMSTKGLEYCGPMTPPGYD